MVTSKRHFSKWQRGAVQLHLSFGEDVQALGTLRKEGQEQLCSFPQWRKQKGSTDGQRVQDCLGCQHRSHVRHKEQVTVLSFVCFFILKHFFLCTYSVL